MAHRNGSYSSHVYTGRMNRSIVNNNGKNGGFAGASVVTE